MSFTTTKLVDDRVLVAGTDVFGTTGTAVVDGSQWAELNGRSDLSKAQDDFNTAVEAFFAPLTDAAEAYEASISRPQDSSAYVVVTEAVEATQGQPEVLVRLTRDSMILRLIEDGDYDRLVWVEDELEILEILPGANVTDSDTTPPF